MDSEQAMPMQEIDRSLVANDSLAEILQHPPFRWFRFLTQLCLMVLVIILIALVLNALVTPTSRPSGFDYETYLRTLRSNPEAALKSLPEPQQQRLALLNAAMFIVMSVGGSVLAFLLLTGRLNFEFTSAVPLPRKMFSFAELLGLAVLWWFLQLFGQTVLLYMKVKELHWVVTALCINNAVVLAVASFMARWDLPDGASGIWPFWRRDDLKTPARIVKDSVLGLSAYLLTIGAIGMLGLANQAILIGLNVEADVNAAIPFLLASRGSVVFVWMCVLVTIAVPIFEEILFRGVLLLSLAKHCGAVPATLITSVFFSAVHFVHSDYLPLFGMSLVACWLTLKTGRLLSAIVFHMTFNTVSIFMASQMIP